MKAIIKTGNDIQRRNSELWISINGVFKNFNVYLGAGVSTFGDGSKVENYIVKKKKSCRLQSSNDSRVYQPEEFHIAEDGTVSLWGSVVNQITDKSSYGLYDLTKEFELGFVKYDGTDYMGRTFVSKFGGAK